MHAKKAQLETPCTPGPYVLQRGKTELEITLGERDELPLFYWTP